MPDALLDRVSYRDAVAAADALRAMARDIALKAHNSGNARARHNGDARAEAIRRVAEWIEQEAMRNA